MDDYKVRIRFEIVPVTEPDGSGAGAADVDGVEQEAVQIVGATKAVSIDDMEEVLLKNSYEVMRQVLAQHFAEVSKRGLSSTGRQPS